MQFEQLNIINPIKQALIDAGYTKATAIQTKAIPLILQGKDILGCAQTGTGKTAAFAIPILQLLQDTTHTKGIKALILTPTRELALQIADNFELYAKYLPIKSLAIYGGVPQSRQVNALQKGIDVLIATPGRLLDLEQQGYINLSKTSILVLDEADHMLDIGFIHDIKKVITKMPEKRQSICFSATMPKAIRKFANSVLHNPTEIAVAAVSSTATTVAQSVYFVEKKEKINLLVQLLNTADVQRSLVFISTKHGADKLVKQLNKTGIGAAAIHGDKSQNARQKALAAFKESQINVLVATDIAARGIDITELPQVVNYELPNVPETYVHRIGRTGRAGNGGIAVSFCDSDQKAALNDIQQLIGFNIEIKVNSN